MTNKLQRYAYTIPWNLLLITLGSVIFGIGMKAIAVPHGLISGGISGLSLLIYYWTGALTPGLWYFLINVPIFILGWLFISRRFFFYSVYGMVALSLSIDLVSFRIPLQDPFLAVLSGGTLIGAGAGITLRSLGSAGGNDIIAVILNQKFNVRMGGFFFAFNLVLFTFSFGVLELDMVMYSLALSFVTSMVLDYFLSIFNQRKMALIISERPEAIAAAIHASLKRGATFLEGMGTYTGKRKKVILTVVNNFQLKQLEEAVFTEDPDAFLIAENTFSVLGRGFSHRKVL